MADFETLTVKSRNFGVLQGIDTYKGCVTHNWLRNFATQMRIFTQSEAVTIDPANKYWLFKTKACANIGGQNVWVEEFGEATEESLEGEIAKKYPAKMASKRAFDAAIITLICPEGNRLYSDSECPNGIRPQASATKPQSVQQTPVIQTVMPQPQPVQPTVMQTAACQNVAATGYQQKQTYVQAAPVQTTPVQEDILPNSIPDEMLAMAVEGDVGPVLDTGISAEPVQQAQIFGMPAPQTASPDADFVITFTRKYQGKTLGEIAQSETGIQWLQFMAGGNYIPQNEEEKKVVRVAMPHIQAFLLSLNSAA